MSAGGYVRVGGGVLGVRNVVGEMHLHRRRRGRVGGDRLVDAPLHDAGRLLEQSTPVVGDHNVIELRRRGPLGG